MTTAEKVEFTVSALTNFLRSNSLRIQRALQQREVAYNHIERGEEGYYRVVWLKESVMRIFDTLEAVASDFNKSHPDEVCTNKDFGDILLSALRTLHGD
jgi:hypothetical protein